MDGLKIASGMHMITRRLSVKKVEYLQGWDMHARSLTADIHYTSPDYVPIQ
jgi:hypothetical protein